ncbi:MAG: hypothetical protein IJ587_13345, partial [Synergistaceae bacterium]|nr:hypothetical protein [Synergistaceae bacterium]
MSEQNANMTLPDAPEKIFSGEVNDVNVSQKGHDTQGTNEKGVDEAIKSETETKTETKTETEARIKTGAKAA